MTAMALSASSDLDRASLPKGHLVYAIGDIHGRADLLGSLVELIEADARGQAGIRQRTLVFLGDYVDRGPDSRGVVAELLAGPPEGFEARYLKGNHEALLLNFLDDARYLDHWLMNGGEATMRSYGVDTEALARSRARPETWRAAFAEALPQSHLRFFKNLKLSVSLGDYFFVHAGVRPGVPLAVQIEEDLIWIRGPFLDHASPFGKVVVHGHTPTHLPVVRPNRIGIDTGAIFTDRLTALRLQDGAREFLHT
jgi:diadenosine tetraphosphatase ApaH/serine/threonine PP2A family protein phosphatase